MMQRARLHLSVWLLVLILAGAAFATVASEPAAVVVQVGGTVEVQRAGQAASIPTAVGMRLVPGDRVLIRTGGRAVLLHHTGRMETISQSTTIPAPQGQQSSELFAQTVSTLAQVAATDARTQPNRQGMIRPIAGTPVGIAPRNEIALLQDRPTFAWFQVPGARGYTIQIPPVGGRPVRYQTGPDTIWTLPDSEPSLAAGTVYEGTVAAVGGGRLAEVNRFRIATEEERELLAAALRALAAGGLDPQNEGLLLAAVLLPRRRGLLRGRGCAEPSPGKRWPGWAGSLSVAGEGIRRAGRPGWRRPSLRARQAGEWFLEPHTYPQASRDWTAQSADTPHRQQGQHGGDRGFLRTPPLEGTSGSEFDYQVRAATILR